MFQTIKDHTNPDTKENYEKERERVKKSKNTSSIVESFSISNDVVRNDENQQNIEEKKASKSFSRSFLSNGSLKNKHLFGWFKNKNKSKIKTTQISNVLPSKIESFKSHSEYNTSSSLKKQTTILDHSPISSSDIIPTNSVNSIDVIYHDQNMVNTKPQSKLIIPSSTTPIQTPIIKPISSTMITPSLTPKNSSIPIQDSYKPSNTPISMRSVDFSHCKSSISSSSKTGKANDNDHLENNGLRNHLPICITKSLSNSVNNEGNENGVYKSNQNVNIYKDDTTFDFSEQNKCQKNIKNSEYENINTSKTLKHTLKSKNSKMKEPTNILVNKDIPQIPESNISDNQKKRKKRKKLTSNIKKVLKKVLSSFSHKNKVLKKNACTESTVGYMSYMSNETEIININNYENISTKGKKYNYEGDIRFSSLTNNILNASPENMDSFEQDYLKKPNKKNDKVNNYKNSNNWTTPLSQYITTIKKRDNDKDKKKMNKSSSTSFSYISKSTLSDYSFSSFSSDAVSNNGITLAATIDSDSSKTNDQFKKNSKRYGFFFNGQKVTEEIEKIKSKEEEKTSFSSSSSDVVSNNNVILVSNIDSDISKTNDHFKDNSKRYGFFFDGQKVTEEIKKIKSSEEEKASFNFPSSSVISNNSITIASTTDSDISKIDDQYKNNGKRYGFLFDGQNVTEEIKIKRDEEKAMEIEKIESFTPENKIIESKSITTNREYCSYSSLSDTDNTDNSNIQTDCNENIKLIKEYNIYKKNVSEVPTIFSFVSDNLKTGDEKNTSLSLKMVNETLKNSSNNYSYIDNEKVANTLLESESITEDPMKGEEECGSINQNFDFSGTSVTSDIFNINDDTQNNISIIFNTTNSSIVESIQNQNTIKKLLSGAVKVYKDSINEYYSPSLSSIESNNIKQNCSQILSSESTNSIVIVSSNINTKIAMPTGNTLEVDQNDSVENGNINDDNDSHFITTFNGTINLGTFSSLELDSNVIDSFEFNQLNKGSLNYNSVITNSHLNNCISSDYNNSDSISSYHSSSKVPVLKNASSFIDNNTSFVITSIMTDSSSQYSSIPDLVTDISDTSSNLSILSSFSLPTTSSSDAYSPLLSSEIPKMPSNISIGVIGESNNSSDRITSFINNKSLDSRHYNSFLKDNSYYKLFLNDINLNSSSIPDLGLTQNLEILAINESFTSNTETSSICQPKLVDYPAKINEELKDEQCYKGIEQDQNIIMNINVKERKDFNKYDQSSNYNINKISELLNNEKSEIIKVDDDIKSSHIQYLQIINGKPEKSIMDVLKHEDNNGIYLKNATVKNENIAGEKPTLNSRNFNDEYITIKNNESNYLLNNKSYKEYNEDTRRDMNYNFYRMNSQKYSNKNILSDISLGEENDSRTIQNFSHQETGENMIDFGFKFYNSESMNNKNIMNNKYLEDTSIPTYRQTNLQIINLPLTHSPKSKSISLDSKNDEVLSTSVSSLRRIEYDIIKKEANMRYNKPYDVNQKNFSCLNSIYSNKVTPVNLKVQQAKLLPSRSSRTSSDKFKNDNENTSFGSNINNRINVRSSCSNNTSQSRVRKSFTNEKRNSHKGIMEKSISNIEEYNKSKNEIVIDQSIINEIFTEKSRNEISSTASFNYVSHNSFDNVGLDYFYNEYDFGKDNYNLLVGNSEKLKFNYLDVVDIYGINSNLRNNSDIPNIPNTSFKNPDFLLGSANTIHASIDYSVLGFKNSCISDPNNNNNNRHYLVPDNIDVVLKVIKPSEDKQKLKNEYKFINEWVSLQRFVPIYGVSTYFNEEVLVIQFYKNGSLGQYLNTNLPISTEEKEEFVLDIVEGLDICHAYDIVHGNLKPSNILLDEYYRALLSDFNMGHMSPEVPSSIQRHWLAPELLNHSAPFTKASDIYSLGLVIYFIFNDGIRYDVDHAECIDYIEKDWPENIRTILLHCLKENPKDRWTVKEIMNHLRPHYQFGSIIDKYINRKKNRNVIPELNIRNKVNYVQENDLIYYNRYPKLERSRKFNKYRCHLHQEENPFNNENLQFALRALKYSLYISDWNYTQAMRLMYGSRDVPCDFQKAIQRLSIPCSEGHVDSLLQLGLLYYDGHGVAKNKSKAYKLWQIAVDMFPNRHALGSKYQQLSKTLNSKLNHYRSSSYNVQNIKNNNMMLSPFRTPIQSSPIRQSCSVTNANININTNTNTNGNSTTFNIKSSPISKPIYLHKNNSCCSYESLVQKKQNLQGFIKCNERTFDLWKEVAERKFIPAFVILGRCYRDGILVESDVSKALLWFKRASYMNDIKGCWYLALCYFIYHDDYRSTYIWLLKASKCQNAEVDTALGLLYYYGIGIPRNTQQALDHFQYAADLGNAHAQYLYCECLNYLYKEKENQIPKTITNEEKINHFDKLFHYCSMAATQGNSRAQFLLGKLYLDGSLKFIRNDTHNYKFNSSIGLQWIRLSAENGNKKAKEFLIEIL